MPDSFEQLVREAEALMNENSWQPARDKLITAMDINPEHVGVLIAVSICYMSLDQAEKAIPHLEKVTELAPASSESWVNLASAYLSSGDLAKAEELYLKATDIEPTNLPGWKMLAQLYLTQEHRMEEGIQILAALIEDYPEDTEALYLLGQCFEAGEDYESAITLYTRAINTSPANAEIQNSLDALKKKTLDADKADLVKKLSGLKSLKKEKQPTDFRIAFYSNGEVSDPVRVINPARALHDAGCSVKGSVVFKDEDLEKYDYFVFSRPQITKTQMEGIRKAKEAGKTIFIDLDDDFMNIPRSHPGYKNIGPGDKSSIRRLKDALGMADYLTTPSPIIAKRYAEYVKSTFVIPNNWWKGNEFWLKPSQRRKSINIGWAGTITHQKDFELITAALEKVAAAHEQVMVIIGGDAKIFDMLGNIPDFQKMFLPMVPHEDYPFMLSNFDILLAPLADNTFNQAKSDIKLLEAGIRKIPWVASPLPAYTAWAEGGILANTAEEWEAALEQLVTDEEKRKALGEAGHQKALTRESKEIAKQWLEILSGLEEQGK